MHDLLMLKTLICSVTLAGGLVPFAAGPAFAGNQHEGGKVDVTYNADDLCSSGMNALGHTVGSFTGHRRINRSGFPLFFNNSQGTTTFTAGGRSVSVRFAGPVRDTSATDNGDGTVTVMTDFNGQVGVITDSNGAVVFKEVGHEVDRAVLDYQGTPGDADDDILLSQTVVSFHGQGSKSSPDAFCPTLVHALFG